jgi:hypothetical protein
VSSAVGLAETAQTSLLELRQVMRRDADLMWKELVGPTVQLLGESTVGSGVLLRSRQDRNGRWTTYLLTSWHVVRDIQEGSDNTDMPIPVAIYRQGGGSTAETATLLEHDARLDAALLKLDTDREIEHGARLAPRARLRQAKIFERVYAVGCPLGNDPIPTFGEIADTHHEVEDLRRELGRRHLRRRHARAARHLLEDLHARHAAPDRRAPHGARDAARSSLRLARARELRVPRAERQRGTTASRLDEGLSVERVESR